MSAHVSSARTSQKATALGRLTTRTYTTLSVFAHPVATRHLSAGTEWRPPISLVEANHRDSPPLKLGVGAQEIASLKVSAVPRVCITAHVEDCQNDPGKTLIPARSTDDVLVQAPYIPVGMSTMLNIHLTWGGGEGQHIERCSMVRRRGAAERETGRFSRAQGGWVGDRGHRRQGMAYVILLGQRHTWAILAKSSGCQGIGDVPPHISRPHTQPFGMKLFGLHHPFGCEQPGLHVALPVEGLQFLWPLTGRWP